MSNNINQQHDTRIAVTEHTLVTATSLPQVTKEFFRDLFIHPQGTVSAFQKADGRYSIIHQLAFTDADIVAHLSGSKTIGLPVMHGDQMKFCVLDIDVKKEFYSKPDFSLADYQDQIEEQRQLYVRHAALFGLADRCYWEHSGYKGMHGWFFFDKYVPVEKVRSFLYGLFRPELVPPVSEAIHTDFYPKSDKGSADVLIRGPWGVNKKSDQRSSWVVPFPACREGVHFVTEECIDQVLSALNAITLNCKAVRDLALKAKEQHHLTHEERFALADLYKEFGTGKLEGDGANYLVDTFIRHCSDYDAAYTHQQVSHITKTGYLPVTCAYLQEHSMCKKQCPLIRQNKSPLVFPYRTLGDYKSIEIVDEFDGKYAETWIVKKFIRDNPGIVYAVPEGSFYEYKGGFWRELQDIAMAARVNSFMMAHCTPTDVTNKRVDDVTKRLTKTDAIHFDGSWNHELLRINLQNGVLDVPTMTLLPHDAGYHFTHQLPFAYDKSAKAPVFTKFFREILEPADPRLTATDEGKREHWNQKVAFLSDWMCYSFFDDYSYQKILNLVGTAGRNGKSRLALIWEKLVGREHVWHEDFAVLAKDQFAKAGLYGKLLNISTDLRVTDQLDMTELKRLSGGDPIVANRKFKPHLAFLNKARLVALSNEVPRLGEIKPATLERFQFLEFEQSFTGARVDTGLDTKLETELPGIFNCIIARFPNIRRADGSFFIHEPEVVRMTLEKFLSGLHNVLECIDECLVKDASSCVEKVRVYNHYRDWAVRNGYTAKAVSNRKFKEVLVGAGIRVERMARYSNKEMIIGYAAHAANLKDAVHPV